MIAQWMLATLMIGVLLTVVGHCITGFQPRLGFPRRSLWLAVMLVSTCVPVGMALRGNRPSPAQQRSNVAPTCCARVDHEPQASALNTTTFDPLYNGLKERVVYALDGWLGVLRIAPYRVDWRSPTGKWTLGKPIALPVVKFDDREKMAYMVGQALLMGDTVPKPPLSGKIWPDVVEQVGLTADPIATPDRKMLVYRTATADYPMTRYDVVNREGVVERQIAIGQRERIVAFGAKSVYVRVGLSIRTDVRLERHPWP